MVEKKESPKIVKQIYLDVPFVKQQVPNWCGYTSTEMVLKFWGQDITQNDIFSHVYPDKKDIVNPFSLPGPSIDTLAAAVEEMTNLSARIIDTPMYEKLKQKNEALQHPMDVLDYFLLGNRPCIIRTIRHFVVVNGFTKFEDGVRNKYSIANPAWSRSEMLEGRLKKWWGLDEPKYPQRDSKFLMLVISPKRV